MQPLVKHAGKTRRHRRSDKGEKGGNLFFLPQIDVIKIFPSVAVASAHLIGAPGDEIFGKKHFEGEGPAAAAVIGQIYCPVFYFVVEIYYFGLAGKYPQKALEKGEKFSAFLGVPNILSFFFFIVRPYFISPFRVKPQKCGSLVSVLLLCRAVLGELAVVKLAVKTALRHKLFVIALLDYIAVFHDENQVRVLYG